MGKIGRSKGVWTRFDDPREGEAILRVLGERTTLIWASGKQLMDFSSGRFDIDGFGSLTLWTGEKEYVTYGTGYKPLGYFDYRDPQAFVDFAVMRYPKKEGK